MYSFEPNPDAIKIARRNSEEYKNHTLIEKAVSDKNGYIKFYPINPELTETTHKDGNIGASSMFKQVNDSLPLQVAPVAQLDSASVYGTEGYRFESYREYFN